MKTKEAIRKDIMKYANMVWETKNFNNTHPLVQLIVEEISHELFLIDNKLKETDYSILCKLAVTLAPQVYSYSRPSHAILKIQPVDSFYKLKRQTGFVLKQPSERIKNSGISSVSYTPVTDTLLQKIHIGYSFSDNTLCEIDEKLNKTIVGYSSRKGKNNTLWIGLIVDPEINNLKSLPFYLDFTHLPDHHEYYNLLYETRWSIDNKPLKMRTGFPCSSHFTPSITEKEILDFYKDHYLCLSNINLKDLSRENLPKALRDIINPDLASSIPPLYWLSIEFPPSFSSEDIKQILVSVNAFPVINRYYNDIEVADKNLNKQISLFSGVRQKFLNIESITDSNNNSYMHVNQISKKGEYTVFPVETKNLDDYRILDYLERLIDIIHNERAAFTGVDHDKIIHILNSISSVQNCDTKKVERNQLVSSSEVASLSVKPYEDISYLKICYWTTHSEILNEIPAKTELMPNKNSKLTKSEILFLTPTQGGKNLYNLETLKALNSFYLTSKGRILTKYHVLSFCKIELGQCIETIDVTHKSIISHKLKEGIIILMEIQIVPKTQYVDYFKQKGVLKDLLLRLKQRSPNNFNYKIVTKIDTFSN